MDVPHTKHKYQLVLGTMKQPNFMSIQCSMPESLGINKRWPLASATRHHKHKHMSLLTVQELALFLHVTQVLELLAYYQ